MGEVNPFNPLGISREHSSDDDDQEDDPYAYCHVCGFPIQELDDGNPCGECHELFCENCLPSGDSICEVCDEYVNMDNKSCDTCAMNDGDSCEAWGKSLSDVDGPCHYFQNR